MPLAYRRTVPPLTPHPARETFALVKGMALGVGICAATAVSVYPAIYAAPSNPVRDGRTPTNAVPPAAPSRPAAPPQAAPPQAEAKQPEAKAETKAPPPAAAPQVEAKAPPPPA